MVPRNGLGLGLGFNRGGGEINSSLEPLPIISGAVLCLDCKSDGNTIDLSGSASWNYIKDISGNEANVITSGWDKAKQPLVSIDGGFLCSGAQVIQLSKQVARGTVILCYKPISENSTLSVMLYSLSTYYTMKTRGSAGGGNGIALTFGGANSVSMAEIGTNNAINIASLSNINGAGIVRLNGSNKSLTANGTGFTAPVDYIATHPTGATYSFTGVIYGIYINSNMLGLSNIQLIENWMSRRYVV